MNIDIKKDTYSIGTVAALLGISPDTLRYYEKRKLITSGKLENGYRYYTNEDLRNLLCILYYRKMNISLNHIPVMLQNNSSSAQVRELLQKQILEEEETILRHRQNIARLTLMQFQNQRTSTYQKGFSIQPFPSAYILDECSSSQEIIFRWFQWAQDTPGLDMAYFYDEYAYSDDTASESYVRSQLLLYEEVADVIPKSFELQNYPMTPVMDCVCYSFITTDYSQISHQIRNMADWAASMGCRVQGPCFTTSLSAGLDKSVKNYEVEIYLPITKP